MTDLAKVIGCIVGLLALFGGIIAYEYIVWGKCLKTESWWYCLRLLN